MVNKKINKIDIVTCVFYFYFIGTPLDSSYRKYITLIQNIPGRNAYSDA